ncbi:hypothetical protein A2U01_0066735, partial [Trifolium medium]|nr:hypothetical protein [Trifolium medium]
TELNDKAVSAIILCLRDNVLRKVAKERSCLLQGEEHGGYTLVETQFEVESSNSGRQSTLAFGYLIGDREESGIVEPNGYDHGDLVGYISIVAEEV